MPDDNQDNPGLIDNDPALDYILYEEMNKDNGQPNGKAGCLGLLLIITVPTFYFLVHIAVA